MERRHSTDSNESSSNLSNKQGSEDVPAQGRVSKTTSPKPPANVLQFVKTGPCDLYRKAQEQLKKSEEIRKEKTLVKNDTEEWQSNLDNWKSSRRKMQEHIIERVVEVKKLEMEEHERNRKKIKTLSEMMQERSQKGRKTSLPLYEDDSSNDLSDLGIGNSSCKDMNGHKHLDSLDEEKTLDNEDHHEGSFTNGNQETKENGIYNGDHKGLHNGDDKESSDDNKESSDENAYQSNKSTDSEEYTYDKAIQNYVNFTENRVKSRSIKSIPDQLEQDKTTSKVTCRPAVPAKPRRSLTNNTDSPLARFELNRKSISTTDLTETSRKVNLPKIDINKRRELFEKAEAENEKINKINRSSVDLNSSKSIKERLTFLEKQAESTKTKSLERPPAEISVKDRLSSIENSQTTETANTKQIADPLTSKSIKDRLSSLEKAKSNQTKSQSSVESTTPLKERLSSLQSACKKEVSKTVTPKVDTTFHEKLSNFQEIESNSEDTYSTSEGQNYNCSTEDLDDIYESKKAIHYRHRSLDSLDVDSVPNGSFERVQSYDDLEYCRNYPASSVSGDTDREDSGIHTADVSSSVSQADDFDLHLDANLPEDVKPSSHQPTIVEECKTKIAVDFTENVSFRDGNDCSSRSYPKLDTSSPLPAIMENPAETYPDLPVVNIPGPEYSSLSGDSDDFNASSNQVTVLSLSEPLTIKQESTKTVYELCEKVDEPLLKTALPTSYISVNTQTPMTSKALKEFESSSLSNTSDEAGPISEEIIEEKVNDSVELEDTLVVDGTVIQGSVGKPYHPTTSDLFDDTVKDTNDIISTTNQIIINTLTEEEFCQPKKELSSSSSLVLDMTLISDSVTVFPLSPTSSMEPPKEKPPPPPVELSDDDLDETVKVNPIRRLDSTKRIKKEIRLKRSSFLGLEGNDDSYIEAELEVSRPPDMATLLAEERRLERQLYRQSLCSETDSNQESRDSGVELDNKPPEPWQHSRNNSDNLCNHSTTSDEDEIIRKEREIIETLEKEEMIRKQQLGEKLAMRLRELEVEKDHFEWERMNQEANVNHKLPENNSTSIEVNSHNNESRYKLDSEKDTINQNYEGGMWYEHSSDTETSRDGFMYQHVPNASSQRIQHQQPIEPAKQAYQQTAAIPNQLPANYPLQGQIQPKQPYPAIRHQPIDPYPYRNSMHDVPNGICDMKAVHRRSMPELAAVQTSRNSMPDLQQIRAPPPDSNRRPPPPALPAKPPHLNGPTNPQQMSRQTLQALSAAPRSRLISNESWQAKRKPKQENCNYQHWLIQEAEHRRITEQQKRQMQQHQQMNGGGWTQVPNGAPLQQQWNGPLQQSQPNLQTHYRVAQPSNGQQVAWNHGMPPMRQQQWPHPNDSQGWNGSAAPQQNGNKPVVYPSANGPLQQKQAPHPQQPLSVQQQWIHHPSSQPVKKDSSKPLPDSIIQTLTQRVQNRISDPNNNNRRTATNTRYENVHFKQSQHDLHHQEKVLSVSGKKRCSACGEELGRGAAMIIESLQLFYHIECFKCCVCSLQLGDGLMGTDVRVRNNKLHCHNCYSSDDGVKFSCV